MFDFDDGLTNFFDKTAISENQNIPLQRGARDTKTNTSGYWLIDTCKNNNLFITNGRVGKDKGVGYKTFRGTSTSDYTVCTANCFEFLTQFEVIDLDPIFSDGHALLSWSFKTNKKSRICTMSSSISKKPLTEYGMQPYGPPCGSTILVQI